MAIKTVAVQVSENTFEVVEALAEFAMAAQAALKDGFQPGDDLPALIAAATSKLIPQFGKLDDCAAEFKEDKEAFIAALLIAAKNAAEAFYKGE